MSGRGAVRASTHPTAVALAAMVMLSGCSGPWFAAGLTVGPEGVTPVVTGDMGKVGIWVTPGTIK